MVRHERISLYSHEQKEDGNTVTAMQYSIGDCCKKTYKNEQENAIKTSKLKIK